MVMIKHNLTYGNVSANDHGIYISGEGVYNAPERVVELVSIPGRNGALTIDQGHFDNITIEYPCFTFATSQEEFRRIVNNFKNAMIAQGGYQRLQDDYNPNEYRMALFVEGIEFEPVQYGRACTFTLTFNCKPQRYLTIGDDEVTVSDGDTINNPTLYDAEPLLMVEGYGDVEFNGYHINIENATMGRLLLVNRGSNTLSFASVNNGRITKTFNSEQLQTADPITGSMTVTVTCQTGDGMTDTYEVVNDNEYATSSVKEYTTRRTGGISYDVGMIAKITLPFSYGVRHDDVELYDTNYVQIKNILNSSDVALSFSMYVYHKGNTIAFGIDSFTNNNNFELSALVEYSDVIGQSSLSILGHPTYIYCELGEAYKYVNGSLVGLNSYIDLGSDLPKLAPSNNTFTLSDTITSLVIVPRWWEL